MPYETVTANPNVVFEDGQWIYKPQAGHTRSAGNSARVTANNLNNLRAGYLGLVWNGEEYVQREMTDEEAAEQRPPPKSMKYRGFIWDGQKWNPSEYQKATGVDTEDYKRRKAREDKWRASGHIPAHYSKYFGQGVQGSWALIDMAERFKKAGIGKHGVGRNLMWQGRGYGDKSNQFRLANQTELGAKHRYGGWNKPRYGAARPGVYKSPAPPKPKRIPNPKPFDPGDTFDPGEGGVPKNPGDWRPEGSGVLPAPKRKSGTPWTDTTDMPGDSGPGGSMGYSSGAVGKNENFIRGSKGYSA